MLELYQRKNRRHSEKGEIIAYIHANNENKAKEAVKKLEEIYVIK